MLKSLKDHDIDFVLFFDGSPPEERVDIFISRKYHDLERIKEIMSCLLRGEDPAGVEQVPLRHVEFCLLSQLKAAGISVSQ